MSHQSGVRATKQTLEQFEGLRNNSSLRLLKVVIENEVEMNPAQTMKATSSLQNDFNSLASSGLLEPKHACYIAFRLPTNTFLFMLYVPDECPVREKMIYASSRDTLKQALGSKYFSAELHGTVPEDFSWEGYQAFQTQEAADNPVTEQEVEMLNEQLAAKDIGGTTSGVHSISFPLEPAAKQALGDFVAGKRKVVALAINMANEHVDLADTGGASGLADCFGKEPRLIFFSFEHTQGGAKRTSTIFVYYCPEGAGVREKMVYSSAKAAVLATAEALGVKTIDKKLEAQAGDEVSDKALMDELYPPQKAAGAFARPARPGRGQARITKRT